MRIGIPREVKDNEYRVAMTPSGVHELVAAGHTVALEADAGIGSSIPDDDFVAAGAQILPTADDVWAFADLVCKVKEPVAQEYHRMRKGQVLFTYLHLAASERARGPSSIGHHRHRVRDGATAGRFVAAARPDVARLPAGSHRGRRRTT